MVTVTSMPPITVEFYGLLRVEWGDKALEVVRAVVNSLSKKRMWTLG